MATTITRQGVFTPSAVDLDISAYKDESSPFSNAYGKDKDNTGSYAEWGLVTGSQANTHVCWTFDLSSIPSNATITNVKCEARCSNTNQSIAQGGNTLIAIGTTNGTAYVNKVDSGNQAFGTTAKVVTVSSADFTREELNNFRLKIQAVRGFISTSTSYHTKFYGATLTIDYEVPVEVNKYTVRFLDYNGNVLDTQTIEEGGNATPPNNPTREGYNFTGWSGSYTNVTQDTDITAQYSIKTFTVRFLDWNNSELAVQTVDYGNSATAPPYPTRDGYLCIGWDNYNFSNITSNMEITAQYVQEQGTPSNNALPPFTTWNTFYDSTLVQATEHSIAISTPKGYGSVTYPYPEEWKDKNVTFTIGNISGGEFALPNDYRLDNENKSITINLPSGGSEYMALYPINNTGISWVTDVSAIVEVPTYTITATSNVGGMISPSGSTIVHEGKSQTYSITPNTGYKIKSVKVDGVDQGSITSYTFTNVITDHTIEVEFEYISIIVVAIEINKIHAIKLIENEANMLMDLNGLYINEIYEDLNDGDSIYLDENGILHVYEFLEDLAGNSSHEIIYTDNNEELNITGTDFVYDNTNENATFSNINTVYDENNENLIIGDDN